MTYKEVEFVDIHNRSSSEVARQIKEEKGEEKQE